MAKDKIRYDDIAEKDLFGPAIESANQLIAVLGQLEKAFKETLAESNKIAQSRPLDSWKGVKETEKAIEDLTDAEKNLLEIEKEKEKLSRTLIRLQSEQIKENAQLRVQIQEQNKANKEAAKEALKLNSLYQQQSKRLNDLRKQYKDLVLSEGRATKESKELLKEITALDKKLKDLDGSVGQFQRNVGNYEGAVRKLNNTLKALSGATGVLFLLDKLKGAFTGTTAGSNALDKGLAQVTVRLNVFVGAIVTAFAQIDKTALTAYGKFESFFTNLSKQLEGYEEQVAKALEAEEKAIDTNTRYAETIVSSSREIAKLRKEQARLQVIADDNTLSFAEQTQAGLDLLKVNEDLSKAELALIEQRLEAVGQRRKAAKEAGVINAEIEQEYADLLIEQADKQAELAERQGAVQMKLRQDASDDAELRLDLLVDTFDREKTINERRIADETENFEKRRALLIETERLARKAFDDQIATLQAFTKERIDGDALVAEADAEVIDRQIESLGLSEVLRVQLRNVIQDRKTGLQDLKEATRDLTRTEFDELKASVALQQEALQALRERGANSQLILKRLAEKTLQQEIENIIQRLAFVEKGSEEELRLKQELNDKLLQQQEARLEKEKKNEEQFREAGLAVVKSFYEKRSAEAIAGIDRELEASRMREQQLERLAEQGAETAERNLALEQKRQAELEQSREQAVQRQKRLELAIAAVETYSAKVQAGDQNALTSTIAEVSLLQAFISSLPAFYEGAENVGDALGKPHLNTSRDGYLIRADGSERIMPGAHNAMIPKSMSNFELAMLANLHAKGKLVAPEGDAVAGRIDELIRVTQAKPVYLGRDYDATERAIVDVVKSQGRIERNKHKVGRLF